MAVQKGLNVKSILFILYGCAIINLGISQGDEDYTAEVKIAELNTKKEKDAYFSTQGQLPKLTFFIDKEITSNKKFYVVDYYYDKSGAKKKIGSSPLCDELPKKGSSELRNKILSTFLFSVQQRCPVNIAKVREPESKTLSFNYDASEVSCNAPWKYTQEIISMYNKEPMVQLTVTLKMEKKGECAS